MKQFLLNTHLILLLRFIMGAVFIYAGWTKIQNPQAFADSIYTYQLLSSKLINLVALGLPPFEILVGTIIVTGWQLRAASFSIGLLCTLFAVALIQALIRGLEIDCGCFGGGPSSIWGIWMSLFRDVLLLIGCGLIYFDSDRKGGLATSFVSTNIVN